MEQKQQKLCKNCFFFDELYLNYAGDYMKKTGYGQCRKCYRLFNNMKKSSHTCAEWKDISYKNEIIALLNNVKEMLEP